MRCIKTGCVAFLQQSGEYVIGDAYLINDVLVIRSTWSGVKNIREYVNFNVSEIDKWFQDKPVSTILTRNYSVGEQNEHS